MMELCQIGMSLYRLNLKTPDKEKARHPMQSTGYLFNCTVVLLSGIFLSKNSIFTATMISKIANIFFTVSWDKLSASLLPNKLPKKKPVEISNTTRIST